MKIMYHANTNPEFRGSDCDKKTAERHADLLGEKMVEYLQGEYPDAEIDYDLVNRDGISRNKPIATVTGFDDDDAIINDIEWYEEKIWTDALGEVL